MHPQLVALLVVQLEALPVVQVVPQAVQLAAAVVQLAVAQQLVVVRPVAADQEPLPALLVAVAAVAA